jgi:predicted ester cyclase
MAAQSDKKEIIRVLYEEVANEGRLELLDEIACADYVEHHPFPGASEGISGLRERVSLVRAALSPQFTLEHVIADEDKVAVMWRNRGTQLADWMGVPATGKSFDIEGVDVYRFREGLLAEHWHVVDVFSMMIQLGAIPAPAGASA